MVKSVREQVLRGGKKLGTVKSWVLMEQEIPVSSVSMCAMKYIRWCRLFVLFRKNIKVFD